MELAEKYRDYPFKVKPFAHQLECWDISKDLKEFALFMEMGTGKSKVLVDNMAYLYDNGKIDGAVVIAPKAVYRTWYNDSDGEMTGEIPTHMPDHVKYYATYWAGINKREKLMEYEVLFKPSDKLHILVMNIESLQATDPRDSNAYKLLKKFLTTHKAMMIIDESTMIKNIKANRTKHCVQLGGAAKYRRIASGFPVTRNPLDLYAQCNFLSWHLLGFSSIWAFRARYAILQEMKLGLRSFKKIVGFQRIDELTNLLKGFSYRKLKEECLDLPPKLYQYREVDMTPEQQKHYSELRLMALTELNGVQVTAAMAMNRIQKLHEIVCGFMRDPVSGNVAHIPNNRVHSLIETLDEVSGKVLIWTGHEPNIHMLYNAIAKEYGSETVATFYGGTKADDRERIKKEFQDKSHKLRFFIGNPATGRFGMTLTEAKTVMYFANTNNLEHRIQSEDRAHRIGQEDAVTYVDFITRGTVDEKLIQSMRMKKDVGEQVMGDGYRDWLK